MTYVLMIVMYSTGYVSFQEWSSKEKCEAAMEHMKHVRSYNMYPICLPK